MKFLSPENILLVGSTMLLLSLFVGKMSSRFGVPSLLLFLIVGMVMGADGIGYHFDNADFTQFIGMMALSVILFSGGMDTKYSDIRPVIAEGAVLATLGVVFTAGLTGAFAYYISGFFGYKMSIAHALLLAAVMSSTDSASVFALLRSKSLSLKENLRPVLELESGSNDPMAYILTIVLIEYIQGGSAGWNSAATFAVQMAVGALCGFILGKSSVWFVNKIRLDNQSLYSVLLVACVFFIFSFTNNFSGNGYLAVYIAGLVVGNSRMENRRSIAKFFDGFTWLWQIIMFLTLGLLVNPKELLPVAAFGLSIAVFLTLLGRPLSVFLCLLPFGRFTAAARFYISWVGLRGAVPIIFATYPLIAGVEHDSVIFNTVFFITILSLVVQGMTVGGMARFLGVVETDSPEARHFAVEFPDEIKSAMSEIEVTDFLLKDGNKLMNLNLPGKTLVMMVKRGDKFFVPKGGTTLVAGDRILVISDDVDELKSLYQKIGVKHYVIDKNL